MVTDRISAFIDRHIAGWKMRDPAMLASNHAEYGVILSPMFHRVEGRPLIRLAYADLFATFPDWEITYDAPIVDGNRVAIFFSVTATHSGDFLGVPGTGRRCAFEGVSLFELDADFLIKEERRVYDFTGLLTRLGILRFRPS